MEYIKKKIILAHDNPGVFAGDVFRLLFIAVVHIVFLSLCWFDPYGLLKVLLTIVSLAVGLLGLRYSWEWLYKWSKK